MSWGHLRNGSSGSMSLSNGTEDEVDVKPNVQLLEAAVSSGMSTLPHSINVSQPPPGFSQSCNQEILVSKSFDCKAGIMQVDNQPRVRDSCQYSNYQSRQFSSSIVPKALSYQNSILHYSHGSQTASELSRKHPLYSSTPANTSNHESGSNALPPNVCQWQQQSLGTLHSNPPPLTNPSAPLRMDTNFNSMVLPPLNLPPPTFLPGNSTITNIPVCTQSSVEFLNLSHSRSENSGNSFQSSNNINNAPLNVPPPNLFTHITTNPNVFSSQPIRKSLIPHQNSSLQVPFNVPPPTFAVPPPKVDKTYPISSIPKVKTEPPHNYCDNASSSTIITNYNQHNFNNGYNLGYPDNTLNRSIKNVASHTRQDCDYYRNSKDKSGDNNLATITSSAIRNDNVQSKTASRSSERTSRFRDSTDRREKSNHNTSREYGSRTQYSDSEVKCSGSKDKYDDDREKRSSSRSVYSNSRRKRSRSRIKDSSRSKSTRSPYQSRSRSPYQSRSSRTKRAHSRSRSRESIHSDLKRSRQSRSRSRHLDKKYRSRRSLSRSKSSRTEVRRQSKQRSMSRSNSKLRPHRSRSRSKVRSSWRSRSGSRSNLNSSPRSETPPTESLNSLDKWRMNNCCSEREMAEKLTSIAAMEAEEIIAEEKKIWTRSAPADLYYTKRTDDNSYVCTEKTRTVSKLFKSVIQEFVFAKKSKMPFDYTANRKKRKTKCSHCASKEKENNSSDSEEEENSAEESEEEDNWMMELQLKQKHPDRLHRELWYNDQGEMNDGPLCRCSSKSRRSGIRHNIYAGEEKQGFCNPDTNNVDKLYHYRVTVSPPTNFLINKPTFINHDNQEFIFEGFSLFSHHPLEKLPTCRVIRFNIQYTIVYIEEKVPEGFSVGETEIFFKYLFHEVLELVDLDLKSVNHKDGCPQFHIMPRFVRELQDNGKELLPMYRVLEYFTSSFVPVISEEVAQEKDKMSTYDWQDFADGVKEMIIVKPGAKPCAIRVDQLDRESESHDVYPDAVHFGSRPLQLCFAGSPEFQKLWKSYVKLRHLVANKPKRTTEDKRRLAAKEQKLQELRTNNKMKRGVTVAVSSRGFYRTGIMCDIVQHAMLIPVLISHLRFHRSLNILEDRIVYKFQNRYLLQLALTHPSYRENFGTNPDHARNTLSNCGVRQPEYGDRRIHFQNTRKRGINTLISIMSKLGRKDATESMITHNERLEFLGDAVVEFITSIHLYHVFPDIEEGGLATYRAAIVQNQHLAHLAKKLGLEEFMLYAHGSDLCHEVELKHAMANSFEALMGALFLDGGIDIADKVFSCVLYQDEPKRFKQWMNYPQHPLQEQEPKGDRHWVNMSPLLKQLQYFEYSTGVVFNHIRLLARVFTTRSMGFTRLTLGSNQRLEFLGDTVLQLITSDYLYNHFPEHHEGHLSLLRSSLVNNRTQSVVCNDIGMPYFANIINPKVDLKMKDRADLLEAFLGAMYIDRGMEACIEFCKVCFFPRLQFFILNQEWNDPKSKLQQCCLTLRTLDGGEPDIPIYKVIEHVGPTNSRSYTVAVYFKNERLAKASGNSIQQAEMNAAKVALEKCPSICPQLDHQRRVIAKSLEMQKHEGVVLDVAKSE